MHRFLLIALALTTCDPSREGSPPPDEETGGGEVEVREPRLPALRELGAIAPGRYLFPRRALGAGEGVVAAELVRAEPDAFVVSVDGGPHRRVPRTAGWPMACTARPVEHAEGELVVRLDAGAPVFVLSSSRDAARVSLGLSGAHSRVVPRDALSLEGCVEAVSAGAERGVGPAPEGDSACLFADQETLDPGAGLPIPSGAAVTQVLEEDGEWARVEVAVPGGTARGWMSANLVVASPSGDADWIGVALGSALCVFPGRPEPRRSASFREATEGASEPPSIPPIEIERVFRNAMPQIQACDEARLGEVPDLAVTMEVLLLVDADGRVSDASITRGAGADAALSRCVLERLRRLRFPAPRTGTMNVRRTFTLRPPAP